MPVLVVEGGPRQHNAHVVLPLAFVHPGLAPVAPVVRPRRETDNSETENMAHQ